MPYKVWGTEGRNDSGLIYTIKHQGHTTTMSREFLTPQDRQVMISQGITEATIAAQLALFRKGTPWIKLHRPCTVGDGIVVLRTDELEGLSRKYEKAVADGRVMKFVPASGAASRMFQALLQQLETVPIAPNGDKDVLLNQFLTNLQRFAFYDDLKAVLHVEGLDIQTCIAQRQIHKILQHLLTSYGLNYANLPKALIKFHRYADHCRTPLEEHMVDATAHALDRDNVVRLHFTISPGCEAEVNDLIEEMRRRYQATGIQHRITLSCQHTSTNTMAVDSDNCPLRDRHHRLLFRPGGHGALLENLQAIQADIVHLNNIDNVVHGRLKDETYIYKRALGGYLVALQDQIFTYLRRLAAGQVNSSQMEQIFTFAKEKLSSGVTEDLHSRSISEQSHYLFTKLNRPIRVCGVVKNLGEPGGGPFWTESAEGYLSLQIVEKSQVDTSAAAQRAILNASTHFNPVDIVCGMRDYQGRPFSLAAFRDPDACFISNKTHEGRPLKALELPGLWNGAMARWNTVFVEVPLSTFNPVKTVFDLLRPEHQP